jgi:uncharacterized RDD family membrane protein YckC
MLYSRTKALTVRTPGGIEFSLQIAGPVSRFLACIIDIFCIWTVVGFVGNLLKIVTAVSEQVGMALWIFVLFAVSMGYSIVLEWFWRGQTLGKKMLRLRVMDGRGLRLKFSQILVRNLLRAVDSLPLLYMVGGTVCLISRRGQRVGDIAANTIVVRIPEIFEPNVEKLFPDKYNSLQEYPHLAARLRNNVSAEESFLVLRALLRRDELDPAARIVLFGELASELKSKVKFPQEAMEGLTDERYLRNAIDVIFRPRVFKKDNSLI